MVVTGYIEKNLHLGIPVNLIAFLGIPLGGYFLIMAARSEYKSVMKEIDGKNKRKT